ncbi:vacuolar fusion protein CCZ1-like protein isoform X1 [Cucumis melo var. makuwa]|uniref:Vacuolar fusion protein CCZ1-like protein isoform X1 n=1 Tax=Cucumis melo var. makuwa TaxID=1194695 RepID=A0A5A7UCB7_CUCMM|nr:vacuolar fusion protein CCZ1-like protein isoform X1 [Cucumis melo var. makuwa]
MSFNINRFNPQSAVEKVVSVIGFGYDLCNDLRLSSCKPGERTRFRSDVISFNQSSSVGKEKVILLGKVADLKEIVHYYCSIPNASLYQVKKRDTLVRQAVMVVKCVLLMYYKNSRGRNYRKQDSLLAMSKLREKVDLEKSRAKQDSDGEEKELEVTIRAKNNVWVISRITRGKELYMALEKANETLLYASDMVEKFSNRRLLCY